MYSKKMGFLLKKKFQKFKYFYGFFYTNLVDSLNKATIKIF